VGLRSELLLADAELVVADGRVQDPAHCVDEEGRRRVETAATCDVHLQCFLVGLGERDHPGQPNLGWTRGPQLFDLDRFDLLEPKGC
jgi:hypothetical protein